MANLINEKAVEEAICKVLEEDMNECLDITTKKVIAELENKVRANVAARLIALVQSDYSMEYLSNELRIYVRMETNRNES